MKFETWDLSRGRLDIEPLILIVWIASACFARTEFGRAMISN